MKFLNLFFLMFFAWFSPDFTFAQDSFVTSVQKSFNEKMAPRAGIEVEVQGLIASQVAEIVAQQLGGQISKHDKAREIETNDPNLIFKYKIKNTTLGTMQVHTDDNSTSSQITFVDTASELVTPPLTFEQVQEFQNFLTEFKNLGALGTEGHRPISTQLTMDFFHNNPEQTITRLLHFLRLYFSPEISVKIKNFFNTPEIRKTYVGSYSAGMMGKINSIGYKPTAEQFFFDFMYRQVLEFNGYDQAWTMSESEARGLVLKISNEKGLEPFLKAVKWNDIKISSLLIYLFPNDPISKFLFQSNWIQAYPAVEFREGNTDFQVLEKYLFLSGLIQHAFKEVDFFEQHPDLLMSGVDPMTFEELMYEQPRDITTPWVIRLVPHNLRHPNSNAELKDILRLNRKKGASAVFVNPQIHAKFKEYLKIQSPSNLNSTSRPKGAKEINFLGPVLIPGESVVYHSLPAYAELVMGKHNPALINRHLVAAIESKDMEYTFWQKFKPGVISRTVKLSDIISPNLSLTAALEKLHREFPRGWILKGTHDSATEKNLITSHSDLVSAMNEYHENFEDFQTKRQEIFLKYGSLSPDLLLGNLTELPGFFGWRIKRFLQRPETAIVQELVDIKNEYRVELALGKVLGYGSTVPRYNYKIPRPLQSPVDQLEVQRVESFAQSLLDALPPKLKVTPFALDVAVLTNGNIVLIESNPGPNSGFLAEDHPGIKRLNLSLAAWPERLRQGLVNEGLTMEEQEEFVLELKGIQTLESERRMNLDLDSKTNSCQQFLEAS